MAFLQQTNHISNSTLKFRIVTLKNFLEFYDVDISPRKFKLKVKLPKVVRKIKQALSKEDVIDILNTQVHEKMVTKDEGRLLFIPLDVLLRLQFLI